MTEPISHELIMRYVDGEASPEERALIDARLSESTELTRELAVYQGMKETGDSRNSKLS